MNKKFGLNAIVCLAMLTSCGNSKDDISREEIEKNESTYTASLNVNDFGNIVIEQSGRSKAASVKNDLLMINFKSIPKGGGFKRVYKTLFVDCDPSISIPDITLKKADNYEVEAIYVRDGKNKYHKNAEGKFSSPFFYHTKWEAPSLSWKENLSPVITQVYKDENGKQIPNYGVQKYSVLLPEKDYESDPTINLSLKRRYWLVDYKIENSSVADVVTIEFKNRTHSTKACEDVVLNNRNGFAVSDVIMSSEYFVKEKSSDYTSLDVKVTLQRRGKTIVSNSVVNFKVNTRKTMNIKLPKTTVSGNITLNLEDGNLEDKSHTINLGDKTKYGANIGDKFQGGIVAYINKSTGKDEFGLNPGGMLIFHDISSPYKFGKWDSSLNFSSEVDGRKNCANTQGKKSENTIFSQLKRFNDLSDEKDWYIASKTEVAVTLMNLTNHEIISKGIGYGTSTLMKKNKFSYILKIRKENDRIQIDTTNVNYLRPYSYMRRYNP